MILVFGATGVTGGEVARQLIAAGQRPRLLGWAQTIKSQGAFYQPSGEGRWAAVDPADIGAVAVKALTTPGH